MTKRTKRTKGGRMSEKRITTVSEALTVLRKGEVLTKEIEVFKKDPNYRELRSNPEVVKCLEKLRLTAHRRLKEILPMRVENTEEKEPKEE